MILAIVLTTLAADARPEWWRAPEMGLSLDGVKFSESGGTVCLDPVASARLSGILERCRAYPPMVDRQLGALFDLHLAGIAAADSQGQLDAERRASVSAADADRRWAWWEVTALAGGVAAAAAAIGYMLGSVSK